MEKWPEVDSIIMFIDLALGWLTLVDKYSYKSIAPPISKVPAIVCGGWSH